MVQLRLDKLLEEKGVTRYRLSKMTDIGFPIIDKYYKNKVVRYDSYILSKICEALDGSIADLVEYVKD